MQCLKKLKIGDIGIIKSISDDSYLKLRLLDIGFTNGSCIECIYESPFGGLRAYRIKNMVIGLRDKDASHIFLEG